MTPWSRLPLSCYFSLSDGRTVTLKNGFVIGRGKNCDLVLDDTKASRRHARLIVEGGVVEIEDLESSNGTLLNGKHVTRRMLRSGDEVQIGKSVLTFQEGQPAGSAAKGDRGAADGASMFDDDDELFGGSAPAKPAVSAPLPEPAPAPKKPAAEVPSNPAPRVPPRREPEPEPEPEPKIQKPVPAPNPTNVVEFADEVVAIRVATPAAKAPARPSASATDPVVTQQPRVLQFSKNVASRNVLGDDVGQMSGSMRALVFVVVIAAMAGLAWLVMTLVR